MTAKDLIRLLRRRWPHAVAVFLLIITGYFGFAYVKERPSFKARARVQLTTPAIFLSAAQSAQWIAMDQKDAATWISIITGRDVLAEAQKDPEFARKYGGPQNVRPEWFGAVRAYSEGGAQLLWIESTATSAELAADTANAVARAAQIVSVRDAKRDLTHAVQKTQELLAKAGLARSDEEAKAQAIRDEVKSRFDSENLETDVRGSQDEVQRHDARKRELERRMASNRLKMERIRSDRTVTEHLRRDALPRLSTASAQSRVMESPRVRALSDRLEGLHHELNVLRRRYTELHPQVIGLVAGIRETELALTREQYAALGRDLDAEEIGLRTDDELSRIEVKVLDPEIRGLRDRLAALSPRLESLRAHERAAAEGKGRIDSLEALRTQFETATPSGGYVLLMEKEGAAPEDAVAVERRLLKQWHMALLAAGILALSAVFLLDFLDTTLRNDYDVRRHLDFPVVAVVPRVAAREVLTLGATRAGALPEIYDTLATVLLSAPSEQANRIFLVTSTNPEEGKTTVSVNLALSLARQGKRTLLVDGDLRLPTIHSVMGLSNDAGLCELLAVQATLGTEGLLREVDCPNLKVLTSGVPPQNPYELLDPARILPLAGQFREQFEAIVIDTPPVLKTGDALKLSSVADSVLFVVEAGRTEQRQATWAKRLLANVKAKVAGVVLNRAASESEEYYYYYSRSSSRSGASRKESRLA